MLTMLPMMEHESRSRPHAMPGLSRFVERGPSVVSLRPEMLLWEHCCGQARIEAICEAHLSLHAQHRVVEGFRPSLIHQGIQLMHESRQHRLCLAWHMMCASASNAPELCRLVVHTSE